MARHATKQKIEKIYEDALAEHHEFGKIKKEKILTIIAGELERIALFETVAERDAKQGFTIDAETADKIGVIWVFSGPGTYEKPFKNSDKFRKYPWAAWMDKIRLNHAALLAKKIAEVRSGTTSSQDPAKTRKMIADYGPYIVYNGFLEENSAFERMLEHGGAILPAEKVKIIHANLETTVDQIKTFELPEDPSVSNKEVALVSHAPHLDRILHMLPKYNVLGKGSTPFLFPVPTPQTGEEQFAAMEVRGLLYRMFITKDATEKPHPYFLISARNKRRG